MAKKIPIPVTVDGVQSFIKGRAVKRRAPGKRIMMTNAFFLRKRGLRSMAAESARRDAWDRSAKHKSKHDET